MSQANRTTGLVDYKELETNILSSIREGRPLTGRDGALTPFIKRLLEASLEGEIESHMSAKSEENNRRNGRNAKTLRTSSGSFELLTPRDREGSFEPQIVKKRQTSLHPELEAKVLSTYASGMGYRDIASHVEEIYDHKISAAEISSITDKLLPVINEWRSRPLQSVYPIVFMDGMFFKVKEDGHCVSKCMYNILGINQNGRKEVLGFYLAESEGANFWLGVLNDLKERGVEDILIACIDGLKSFPTAINSVFPSAEVQLCKEKFRDLKTSNVLAIREEVIEKVLEKFKNHNEIRPIMVYTKNLFVTYDEHLYSKMSMKEKVDHHIDLIIKNTSEEREEKLLRGGATPEEVYQIFRTVQGSNLYRIRLLSERGGAALEIYIRKELQRRLKLLFNRFKERMIKIGVDTEKDFFLIARRHFSFLFTKKYVKNRKKIMREVRHILALIRENPFDVLKDYDKLCKGVGPP